MTIESATKVLLEMFEKDQTYLREHSDDEVGARNIAAENLLVVKQIVDEFGWPTISMFGKDASFAAWILVQHADEDPDYQARCLDLMLKLPDGEVAKENIAYLTDRVLVGLGKLQIYGTQTEGRGDYIVIRPTDDIENLDKRREEYGLFPMSEYFKMFDLPVFMNGAEYMKSKFHK